MVTFYVIESFVLISGEHKILNKHWNLLKIKNLFESETLYMETIFGALAVKERLISKGLNV